MLWKDKEIFLSFPNQKNSEFHRVFIQTDKYTGSGSLRYTFSKEEADNGKCRNVFKNLDKIDIVNEKEAKDM